MTHTIGDGPCPECARVELLCAVVSERWSMLAPERERLMDILREATGPHEH